MKFLKNIWKKIEKFKRLDIDLSSHQRDWEEFEKSNASIALNVLFVSHNKHKKHVILPMINDEFNNYYYFALKIFSELNSFEWLRWRKAAITNDNDFQNALNDALNYQNIETRLERISKIKPYIRKYSWKGIEFPAGSKDWKRFEQNSKAIAVNALFVPHNTKTIRVAYRSEYNHKREKQEILLIITDGIKLHYLAVTNLSALLERKLSNHHGDFYCLNCFNSYSTKKCA